MSAADAVPERALPGALAADPANGLPGRAPVDPARPDARPGRPERPGRRRDQYIDGLRALALVRVMTYHTFGWVWLPVAFPSMGVMFALGGSLVAASLSASPGQARVLRRRIRRLLPPLWLYGAVVVIAMAARAGGHGWTVTPTAGTPLTWRSALYWLVPLADPPGSAWGYDLVLPLWYIRTYLWLLLLSPFALWLFRRYPLPLLAVPALALVATGQGMIDTSTPTGDSVQHLAIFGVCWMLGFAHHDGRIIGLPRARTVAAALLLMAAGLTFAITHQQPDSGWDIDNIDVANAGYSAGAVLLLLRLYPRRTVLDRLPRLSKLVAAMNSRAMTIYLWGNLCIWAATPVLESNPWSLGLETPGPGGQIAQFTVAWLLLLVVVLAAGWVEDVAAGRPPRINPWPRAADRPARRVAEPRRRPVALWAVAAAAVAALGTGVVLTPRATAEDAGNEQPLPVAGPVTPGPSAPSLTRYPLHRDVLATVFWIGAIARPDAGEDGQSLSSAWDARWAQHYGGCDGLGTPGARCTSDVERRQAPDWFPTATLPRENPYYLGLPYNDLISSKSTDRRAIPWSGDPGFSARLHDRSVSFLKNRWVAVSGPSGTCYGQLEDSGPGPLDPGYVLGTVLPAASYGINLSPALYRCVGLRAEAGSGTVAWRFVDAPRPGPWARIITTRQVS
ncbi:MAG TPA: acyltransferase family protein [Kineosporiaceae bacterium]